MSLLRRLLPVLLAGIVLGGLSAAAADEASPAPVPAAAPVSPLKAAKIRQLLELTGAEEQGEVTLDQTLKRLQAKYPKLPPAFWESLKEKMNVADLIDLLVPVYAKYYSDEDLDGLIAFHSSPLGRKLAAQRGPLLRESRAVGQKWGTEKAAAALEEIRQAQADAD